MTNSDRLDLRTLESIRALRFLNRRLFGYNKRMDGLVMG